jgi:transposase-like protein
MHSPHFKKWLASLPALNPSQRRQVLEALRPVAGLDQLLALLDGVNADRRCPDCASPHWHRYGQANGLQRYRCRACRRTFNDLSGTPLARLRLREQCADYLGASPESLSVRAAAQRVGVHRNTAFRWRHRFPTNPLDSEG